MHGILMMLWCVGTSVWLPIVAQAAGNPVVEAVTKGSAVQFTGKESVFVPVDFDGIG